MWAVKAAAVPSPKAATSAAVIAMSLFMSPLSSGWCRGRAPPFVTGNSSPCRLFADPQGQGARIIMISALGDRENVVEAIQRCDAYLVKPFQMADLIGHLKRFGLV